MTASNTTAQASWNSCGTSCSFTITVNADASSLMQYGISDVVGHSQYTIGDHDFDEPTNIQPSTIIQPLGSNTMYTYASDGTCWVRDNADAFWTVTGHNHTQWASIKPLTKKQLERERRRSIRRNKQLAKAKLRADKLLRKWLTKDEYKALKENDKLIIKSKLHKDTEYIVHNSGNKRVERHVNNKYKDSLCVTCEYGYENDDVVLAKILAIQTNEERFLKVAVPWRNP